MPVCLTVLVSVGVLLGGMGCGARRPVGALDCGTPIRGTQAQLTLVSGVDGAPTFDAPIACLERSPTNSEPGYYVRVVRAEGARTISFARSEPTECDVMDADPAACPDISVHVLGMVILDELRKELGELNADSFGLGACADHRQPITEWHLGNHIHDWRLANRAIEVTDATLARWNVRGEWGVSVTEIPCGVAE